MENSVLWCLHGFLGEGTDWDQFDFPNAQKPHFFKGKLGNFGLKKWAKIFNKRVEEEADQDEKHFLLGYSMGGRLALHALLADPELWSGAIIVSSHLGLESEEEKLQRKVKDEYWAEKFSTQKWDQVIADWNKQAVFQSKCMPFQRKSHNISKD